MKCKEKYITGNSDVIKTAKKEKRAAIDAASSYLGRRIHTSAEVRDYLKGKDYSSEEIEAAVAQLEELHYLDDVNYVKAFIRYSLEKSKSVYAIRYELSQKGVSDAHIQKGIFAYEDEEEVDLAAACLERASVLALKLMGDDELTDKLQARIGRRLSALGYSGGEIYKIIGSCLTRPYN